MQTMHLLPGVAIQPNLELKTWPKPVLGSLLLAFALPGACNALAVHAMLWQSLQCPGSTCNALAVHAMLWQYMQCVQTRGIIPNLD